MAKTMVRVACAAAILFLLGVWTACGDYYRPVANPLIPNQPNPGFSHLALVLSDNGASNPGASTTIDVSGDTALSQATVGLMPVYAALLQNGTSVYVANRLDDSVSQFSSSTPTPVTTISLPTGSAPSFVASTESATVYVANAGSNTISAIATTSNVITNTISVGVNPVGMAEIPNGQKLYVANAGNGTGNGSVTSVNILDKSVNPPIANGAWSSPVWIAARSDSQRVYVLDSGTGNVSAIDTFTDTVVGTASVGVGADFMLYDPILNRVYVTNPGTGKVVALNASSDALTPMSASLASPVSVAALPDGSRVYVSSAVLNGGTVNSRVTVLNAADLTVKTTIPLTSLPAVCATRTWSELAVAAAADSTRVYVGNCDAGNTAIIQTTNDTVLLQMAAPVSAAPPSTVRITAASQIGSSTIYTYTLSSGPSLRAGMSIAITGLGNINDNGTFAIVSAGSGTFTVANASGASASGQSASGIAVSPQSPVFVLAGP